MRKVLVLSVLLAATLAGQAPAPREVSAQWWGQLRTAAPSLWGTFEDLLVTGGPLWLTASNWFVAVPLDSLSSTSFSDAHDKFKRGLPDRTASTIYTGAVQVSSSLLPYQNAGPAEIEATKKIITVANPINSTRIVAYIVPSISSDAQNARKLFEFAKALSIQTIVVEQAPSSLEEVDKLAGEYNVNVGLLAGSDPAALVASAKGRSSRVGIVVDTAKWQQLRMRPAEAVSSLQGRLFGVRLRGTIDSGMLHAIHRAGAKPLFVAVEYNGSGDPVMELSYSLDAFEDAFRPVAAARLAELGRTIPTQGWAKVPEQNRVKVNAAIPDPPPAKPRTARRLLVMDISVGHPHHPSVPYANYAIQQWSSKTKAFTPVFSNDPENLKFPKIREYDAIFLNNTVGQVFLDPQVRTSMTRYVREGGGLVGFHGVAAAQLDWREFSDMTGARLESRGTRATPRPIPNIKFDEQRATLKVEVPDHLMTKHFGEKRVEWMEEYYTFAKPPFSRDKMRVLLSIDFTRTDMGQ
jgi:hypothetical protein